MDRKTANVYVCDSLRRYITCVNSSTKLAHGTLPESFAIVLLQTYISAIASYNVFVVDTTATVRGMFALPFFLTVTLTPT